MDPGSGPGIDLLVFTGSNPDVDEAVLMQEVRAAIKEDMGDEFQPDRIAIFQLYPRFLSDTEVDHDWCRDAYLTGGLSRRFRGEIFQCITRLRGCLYGRGC